LQKDSSGPQLTQNSNPSLNPRLDRELWVLRGGWIPEANSSFQALPPPWALLSLGKYVLLYHGAQIPGKEQKTTKILDGPGETTDIRSTLIWTPHIIFYNGHLVLSYNSANRNMTNILCFSLVEQSKAMLGNMNPVVKRPQISLSMMKLYYQCCAKYKHINTRTF
jgi:hypothetical protein